MRGSSHRALEIAFWGCLLAVYFLFPDYLSLATAVAIMALFALSLDLVLGFAGIISMGHAMFFGIGAYAAGWLALSGWTEPISAALVAGIAAAGTAALIGPYVLRMTGLPLIMVTFVLGLILFEAANKATDVTGGDNGLSGFKFDTVLGMFSWSVYGRTEYLYVLAWLFGLFYICKTIVASPFGLALRGIRENPVRMAMIGSPVRLHLLRAYVVSALIAGIAGALSAQTTKFVSLASVSADTSIFVMVMLVLGGVGTLYGAIVGAVVYMVVHHFASEWNPYHWMFIIGILLLIVVRIGHGGILGIAGRMIRGTGAPAR